MILTDNLGNACLTSFFVTGAWDHAKLQQSLKAYQNAVRAELVESFKLILLFNVLSVINEQHHWFSKLESIINSFSFHLTMPTCSRLKSEKKKRGEFEL